MSITDLQHIDIDSPQELEASKNLYCRQSKWHQYAQCGRRSVGLAERFCKQDDAYNLARKLINVLHLRFGCTYRQILFRLCFAQADSDSEGNIV